MQESDLVVIGGGIVGLATAYRFVERMPGKSVVVLEKEPAVARHQSGHNSGVLHSGIYYKPGSLKAENCREGRTAMVEFCRAEGIPFDICGKVIVAVDPTELPALDRIRERGQQNRVECEVIERDRLTELEPHAAGVRALKVPSTGIVDYVAVCLRLAEKIEAAGGQVRLSAKVEDIRADTDRVVAVTPAGEFSARCLVNCAGLYSDKVASLSGAKPTARIIPFRGEYYELREDAKHLVKNLIYPVPD
ncbi:MAG: L-2-hydroxyglutarate oxidase, partial [Planctomycetales bacterium]|nr:L-2-hydroxyglutarate oxidase [Planctomycetales bacterium]